MKKLAYLAVMLLAGPAKERTPLPPMPPMPPLRAAVTLGPAIPTWMFTNIRGNYAIDTSTNLTDWWPTAEVYHVTNINIISLTAAKHPILFYRIRPL